MKAPAPTKQPPPEGPAPRAPLSSERAARPSAEHRPEKPARPDLVGQFAAIKIATIYAVAAALWIVLTDWLVSTQVKDPQLAKWIPTVKGWFFVLVTAGLLYWGLSRYLGRIRRTELRSRETEDRYGLLVSSVKDYAIVLLDPQGRVTSWNIGGRRITGYEELEILGQPYSCFFLAEDVQRGKPAFALQTAASQGRFEEEVTHVRKDGKRYWADTVLTPLYSASRGLCGFAAIIRDITERKVAEAKLWQANRALHAIVDCGQAVMRAHSEQELLEEVCRLIVEQPGYRLAWVGYAEPDEAKTVRPVAQAGHEAGYLQTACITWADTDRGRGPVGMSIRTGQHFVVQNIETEPFFSPWREEARRRGYAALISLPLLRESRAFGALVIYAGEADAFGNEEVRMLSELAGDLAIGIMALRGEAERQEAEAALRRSEARFRGLTEQSLAGVYVIQNNRFVYVNPQCAAIFGCEREEMLAETTIYNFIQESDRATVAENMRQRLEGVVSSVRYAISARRKDGQGIYVEVHGTRIDWNGRPAILGTLLDITERRQAQEQLQALSRHLVQVQEAERRHLARELHDEVGQGLTALKITLQGLRPDGEGAEGRRQIEEGAVYIDQLLQQVRHLSLTLRPPLLDDLGLVPALRWLVSEVSHRTGLQAQLRVAAELPRLHPDLETTCFRIIQEALANVSRHATAKQALVEVIQEESLVRLRVKDDGRGFDYAAARQRAREGGSLGLLAMAERASLAGGRFECQSQPGQGTTIEAAFPIALPPQGPA